jgi:hypothetical protein
MDDLSKRTSRMGLGSGNGNGNGRNGSSHHHSHNDSDDDAVSAVNFGGAATGHQETAAGALVEDREFRDAEEDHDEEQRWEDLNKDLPPHACR